MLRKSKNDFDFIKKGNKQYRPQDICPGFWGQKFLQLSVIKRRASSDIVAEAYFPFVNGRCHLKWSMPFFSSELHSLGLRTQKVAVTGSCVSLVIWVRVRVRVLFRVRAKNASSSLEIFGLFFSSSFSFINVFFSFFFLNFFKYFFLVCFF